MHDMDVSDVSSQSMINFLDHLLSERKDLTGQLS